VSFLRKEESRKKQLDSRFRGNDIQGGISAAQGPWIPPGEMSLSVGRTFRFSGQDASIDGEDSDLPNAGRNWAEEKITIPAGG
jgi:hypothetical protein